MFIASSTGSIWLLKKLEETWKKHSVLLYMQLTLLKANSLNDRLFMQFCEAEKFKTLLLHTEVRWLSKSLSLKRFVNFWKQVINFLKFKFQMAVCNNKKQADKAKAILEKLEAAEIKSTLVISFKI